MINIGNLKKKKLFCLYLLPDEEEEKGFVHDELAEEPETLLLSDQVRPVPLQHAVVLNAWKISYN